MNQFVSVAELVQEMRAANPPVLIDVRRRPAFESDTHRIAGAVWLDPEHVDAWAPALAKQDSFVVYCVHGHEVGKNCASALQRHGMSVRYLEGGIESFKLAGGRLTSKS